MMFYYLFFKVVFRKNAFNLFNVEKLRLESALFIGVVIVIFSSFPVSANVSVNFSPI